MLTGVVDGSGWTAAPVVERKRARGGRPVGARGEAAARRVVAHRGGGAEGVDGGGARGRRRQRGAAATEEGENPAAWRRPSVSSRAQE